MVRRLTRGVGILFRFHRQVSIALQLLMVALSNGVAFLLRFDGQPPAWAQIVFWTTIPLLVAVRGLTFIPFRLYQGLWRYTSIYDLKALAGGIGASTLIFFALMQTPLGPQVYPRSIFITDAIVLTLLLGGLRLTRRIAAEFSKGGDGKRVLVFGAGDAGELIVRDMIASAQHAYQPIGFIDDDRSKVGRRIHGVPVLGTRHDLPRILKERLPDEVLIAVPGADPDNIRGIVRVLAPYKIPIKTLPRLLDIIDGKVETQQIRSLAVEDLLTRAPVGLDPEPVKHLIAGRRVMVTGAGGSIGSELCRQIATLAPASLVMLDRYENSLHAIRIELEDATLGRGLHAVIADVTDAARIEEVMLKHSPEIVFHAAAHKHVPLMEENPCEAVKNNVRGTRILAEAAEKHGVDRFIFISTDKAVNPTNMMGASKRTAELVVQARALGSGTSFSIVRFGNVLGSNGSVVPRFMDQIRRGGPVTITHPEIRRFFMLIPEAVQLVLHAAAQAESGSTYVLEMGEQVKLIDMARDLIRLSGLVPDEDIRIEVIGLRPGEKLYEELVGMDEEASPSLVDKILRVRSLRTLSRDDLARITALEELAFAERAADVLAEIQVLVGTFGAVPETFVPAAAAASTAIEPLEPAGVMSVDVRPCPACKAGQAHRSRARTIVERVRRGFGEERLYRCESCGWRGWLVPMESGSVKPLSEPAAPDLAALDAVKAPVATAARSSFSPRNLE